MDASAVLLRAFCADLRLLWTQAGGPSLRTLSAHVGLGKSQVGAILGGDIRQLPDWDVIRGLVESVRRHAAEHGRVASLSLSTGIEEFWRPRYTMVEHSRRRPVAASAALVVPRQLPPAIRHLAGRSSELDTLTRLLDNGGQGTSVIAVIDGTAGVGKTTLAVSWANAVAARFRDGQLYFNLRGFDPTGTPAHPTEAIRAFLDALDVPPERIPSSVDAQIGLYRSLLAHRRILVVLDNVRDADQVRPLLPGSPGCVAIVTSRNRLPSLIANEGAHPLPLGLLSDVDARELLMRRLGNAEPHTIDGIVARCAGLPLALAIAASHAALNSGQPIDQDLDRDELGAVFDWSYRALEPPAARMFRLLGLHPGPDIGACAAASLAGVPLAQARSHLSDLVRANLLAQPSPGRYALHDLLRAYAFDQSQPHESNDALHRVLDHYLHTTHAAKVLFVPSRDPITLAAPREGAIVPEHNHRAAAIAWLRTEHTILLGMVQRAAAAGFDLHVWQLTQAMHAFLDREGRWHDLRATQRLALEAARRLGDRGFEATALSGLSWTEVRLGRYETALGHVRQALHALREVDNRVAEAHIQHVMSIVLGHLNRRTAALSSARRSLELFTAFGHRAGQAKALNMLAMSQFGLGRHREAIESCERSLALSTGDREIEGHTRDTIGLCHHHLGEYRQAIACFNASLAIFRDLEDRYNEADVLKHLGDTYDATGDVDRAVSARRDAHELLNRLGHPDAVQTLARL